MLLLPKMEKSSMILIWTSLRLWFSTHLRVYVYVVMFPDNKLEA